MGTVAIINAAKYFSQYPPKRSLLFLAVTAEEVGLLGSSWYKEFPVIPYERTVFNLNTDGAGYNDTSIATILGLGRTNADQSIIKGCEAFGLKVGGDPAPEQNLYDRSDNVNFAIKGVPAITFSPGVAAFDEEINKYYHQPIDEVESMDFDYVMKFNWAFVYSAQLIANMETTPYWTTGDKYESAAKTLYGK